MALIAGDARKNTGLAGALATELAKVMDGFDVNKAYKGINAQAKAIIEYLTTNAQVVVTESPGGHTLTPSGVGHIE